MHAVKPSRSVGQRAEMASELCKNQVGLCGANDYGLVQETPKQQENADIMGHF